MATLEEARTAKQKLSAELERRGLIAHASGGINIAVGIGRRAGEYTLEGRVQFAEEMPEDSLSPLTVFP